MKFDFTGRDPSGWAFLGCVVRSPSLRKTPAHSASSGRWLHDGIFYPTTADFRHAWSNGKVAKTTRNAGMNETWIGTDRDGAELPYDNRPPPIQIAPGGQRFAIDEDAQYVEWMESVLAHCFRQPPLADDRPGQLLLLLVFPPRHGHATVGHQVPEPDCSV